MGYEDFWFIDTRVQTRNLRRWLIWFIVLFTFVTVGSIMAIKTMYHNIKTYQVLAIEPTITVEEAKATNVNGYIKGEVTNNTDSEMNGKKICFSLFNSKNESVGEEYLEIENLQAGETKTYELKFKRNNVDKFVITITE